MLGAIFGRRLLVLLPVRLKCIPPGWRTPAHRRGNVTRASGASGIVIKPSGPPARRSRRVEPEVNLQRQPGRPHAPGRRKSLYVASLTGFFFPRHRPLRARQPSRTAGSSKKRHAELVSEEPRVCAASNSGIGKPGGYSRRDLQIALLDQPSIPPHIQRRTYPKKVSLNRDRGEAIFGGWLTSGS